MPYKVKPLERLLIALILGQAIVVNLKHESNTIFITSLLEIDAIINNKLQEILEKENLKTI